MRGHLGLDPYANAAADRPMVLTPTGYVPIEANAGGEGAGGSAGANGQSAKPDLQSMKTALQKASPDDAKHPGWPAGTPGGKGGQFRPKDGGDSSSDTANNGESNRPVQYAALDTGTGTDTVEGESGVQVAASPGRSGYPVDLLEEEAQGGHTIAQHVGKSEDYLLSLISNDELAAQRHGAVAQGLREGSFPSLEAASKLVNSTVSENPDKVDLVTSGVSPREQLDAEFGSPTGYEAYARTERSIPYIRDTYGVRVIIVPDRNSAKGYRVGTAFPINF